jgi:hypothetical protein
MRTLNQKTKLILYPILYWVVFLIIPSKFIAPFIIKDGGWIILYLLIFPFLFFIPYKLAQPKSKKEKLFFIILGFVLPFLIFYTYLYMKFLEGFNPSF